MKTPCLTPDQIGQRAEELFKSGLCCAESVLLATAESRGLQSELIPRIASGLCGGLARTSGACGAASGGALALSLVYGRDDPSQSIEPCYQAVRKFLTRFDAQFGTTNCSQLIGIRLDTPEGMQYFQEHQLRQAKCEGFVREAARLVAEVIEAK